MDHEDRQDDSWNKYWEHGFLTSCSNAFAGNYEGTLRDCWLSFFGRLSRGSRVLDLCTGNGAIAMIANEVSREKGMELEIHGIDSAAIRPHETVSRGRELLDGIRFHGGVAAESTGFEDQYFQAIAGQYALEYTDVDACAAEMARIAAPGAVLQFIVHHDRSIVMKTSQEEIRNAALLFEETLLFDRARAVIERVGLARTPAARRALKYDPEAEAAREALNRAAARVSEASEASPHPQFLQMAMKNVAEAYRRCCSEGVDAGLAVLEEGRGTILANLERLEDLMAAGRNEAQMTEITAAFARHGLSSEAPAIVRHDDGPLMGWILSARRS
jgi:ubiquinone/menaquinone biosynthesis C-methylase UbiE